MSQGRPGSRPSRPRREREPDVRARTREERVSTVRAGIEGIALVIALAAGVGVIGFVLALVVSLVY